MVSDFIRHNFCIINFRCVRYCHFYLGRRCPDDARQISRGMGVMVSTGTAIIIYDPLLYIPVLSGRKWEMETISGQQVLAVRKANGCGTAGSKHQP